MMPEVLAGEIEPKSILAVLVLYKVAAEESQSFLSLREFVALDSNIADAIELIVCDNSPYEQSPPAAFEGLYLRDSTNAGLAKCYNVALRIAQQRKMPWLLLLDQDTTLTLEYLREIVRETRTLQGDESIVALVPKLVQNDVVQSPHAPPSYRHRKFKPEVAGRFESRLYAFNSGSVIRVAALEAIGGFPEKFWLDFLDHATFHLLQQHGGKLFVLHACLAHQLSTNDIGRKDAAARKRYRNVLDAEHMFYKQHGSATDRIFHRVRLLRGFLGTLLKRRRVDEALEMLKAAIRP
jgi:GT2 family glycosyltransferase